MTTTTLFKLESAKQETPLGARRDLTAIPSSIRVPVTQANRDYLRALRQAELDAWRNAPGGTVAGVPRKRTLN